MENRFSKFTVLISNINRYINRIKSEEMLSFGLRSVHVSCLFYLFKNENGLTASELCSMCEEDKGAISRSLEFLEENNYIICEQSDKKKYRAKLYLTDRGKEIGARILEISDNAVEIGSRGLSDEERANMYKALEIIAYNLKNKCENYGEKDGNKNNN